MPYEDEKGISESGEIEPAISFQDWTPNFFELIGADEDIWPTRNRGQFYRFIPSAVGEISIRDTVHEDAQYPNQHTLRAFQDQPRDDTEEAQIAVRQRADRLRLRPCAPLGWPGLCLEQV